VVGVNFLALVGVQGREEDCSKNKLAYCGSGKNFHQQSIESNVA